MFKLIRIENGRLNVPEPVIYEVGATAVTIGEALVLSGGKLVACSGATKPEFIAMGNAGAGEKVAVCHVESNQVYEVPVSAAPTSLKAGDKVTVATDGLAVTATTSDGVVTIINTNGATKAGDTIVVRI